MKRTNTYGLSNELSLILNNKFEVATNDILDVELFIEELLHRVYIQVPKVEDIGEFAVRGSIVDFWSPGQSTPSRIEFFDDSDVGIYQCTHRSWFVWHCISLHASGQHHIMLDTNSLAEEEDFWIHEDSLAYSGDRRTY